VFSSRVLAGSLLVLALGSCQKPEPAVAERLAILPFENLASSPEGRWAATAASLLLEQQLAMSRDHYAFPAPDLRAALDQRPTRALHGSVEALAGGRVLIRAALEDLRGNRFLKEWKAQGRLEDALRMVAAWGVDAGMGATPAIVPKVDAVRALADAAEAKTIDERQRVLETAVMADPACDPARLALAEVLVARGKALEVRAVLAGVKHPAARAQADLLLAALTGDPGQRRKALDQALAVSPANSPIRFAAAAERVRAKEFDAAVRLYREALDADPENAAMWNTLGYAHAYRGDTRSALAAIDRYAQVAPMGDANPGDSRGEVLYMGGRYAEAAQVFREQAKRFPRFFEGASLWKAAYAEFLAGNRSGADEAFARFFEMRGGEANPRARSIRAVWVFQTGRGPDAVGLAAQASGSANPVERAVFQSLLCEFHLAEGRRQEASLASQRALAAAPGNLPPMVCGFLAQPAAEVAVWEQRLNEFFDGKAFPPGVPKEEFRKQLLASALYWDGKWAAAYPLLKERYERLPPESEGETRLFLARTALEMGKRDEARALLRYGPIPPVNDAIFSGPLFRLAGDLRAQLK
jgi:tetratricopeptide (TPR) repeat protein